MRASAASRRRVGSALVAFVVSVLALALAPLLMPPSYDWVVHSTSESAAQGVEGAWLARLGFLAFAAGVGLVTVVRPPAWGRFAVACHATFGGAMVLTAAFSARSWDRAVPYDPLEDLLHSVSATAMGFAFALGVAAVAFGRRHDGPFRRFDVTAVAAAVILPLGMLAVPDVAGVLQRAMFVIAYGWYVREAVGALRRSGQGPASMSRPVPPVTPGASDP